MRLSTSLSVHWSRPHMPVERAVERLARVGFTALDFNFCDWVGEDSPLAGEDWQGWLRRIREAADRSSVGFSQAHAPIWDLFEESEKAARMTELSRRALEGSAILGVRWIVFHPESRAGAFDAAHVRSLREDNLAWFSRLLPIAEKTGVGLALENTTDAFGHDRASRRLYCSTPGELIELVDAFRHPLIGICWDTGHAELQRLDQAAAIRSLGGRLKALHVQDNDGREDQHLLPFLGVTRWVQILGALKAIGYAGDFTYEIHNYTKNVPDELRDAAMRYAAEVGRYLLSIYDTV